MNESRPDTRKATNDVQGLTLRSATRADVNRIADLMLGDPEYVTTSVALRLFGIERQDQANLLFHAISEASQGWESTTVAEMDGQLIGFLLTFVPSLRLTPGLLLAAGRIFGPFFMRKVIPRIKLLGRVQTAAPAAAYRITELHIAPGHRGHGIETATLHYAEKVARATRYSVMALQTWTTNPAQELYQRFGFEVIDTCTDAEFERLTGVAGNYLMIKQLG